MTALMILGGIDARTYVLVGLEVLGLGASVASVVLCVRAYGHPALHAGVPFFLVANLVESTCLGSGFPLAFYYGAETPLVAVSGLLFFPTLIASVVCAAFALRSRESEGRLGAALRALVVAGALLPGVLLWAGSVLAPHGKTLGPCISQRAHAIVAPS